MSIKVRPLSYSLGAEIIGVDIRRPLEEITRRQVRDAMLKHCVVVFRGTPFSAEQHVAFARQFGEVDLTQGNRHPDFAELSLIINRPKSDGGPPEADFAGSDWHSDRSYNVRPYGFSMLHAVEIPPVGGDTQFANMYLAYETLSDGMKKLLDGLECVHIQEEKQLDHSSPERLLASRHAKTVAHPLVRVHPETGRKALYVGDKAMLIGGMTAEESRPLIDFLRMHARRPQFIYLHQWQKHDLLIWDNRCLNHNALGNYDRRTQLRHMEKTSLQGHVSGRLYDDPAQTRNVPRAIA